MATLEQSSFFAGNYGITLHRKRKVLLFSCVSVYVTVYTYIHTHIQPYRLHADTLAQNILKNYIFFRFTLLLTIGHIGRSIPPTLVCHLP